MVEFRTRSGWMPLAATPKVPEHRLELRGADPGESLTIGGVEFVAGRDGSVAVSLSTVEGLWGHVGLAPVRRGGRVVGEIDIVPEKMSQVAFEVLRGELRTVWGDLVLARGGPTATSAGLPPATELLRRIEVSVQAVFAEPREQIGRALTVRQLHQCRRPRELTPTMVRRGAMGLVAAVPTADRTVAVPEATLVAETLDRLGRLAVRQGDTAAAARLAVLARHPTLAGRSDRVRTIPWGARSDPRYRQIHAVWRLLDRPELEPVIGPGELRLGVKALPRLFEYWVFLQTLREVERVVGPPVGSGYSVLARPAGPSGLNLELSAGTQVEFPGGVKVAFEPAIFSSGTGWGRVEYVPHPDPDRAKTMATPDVVVLQEGDRPAMVVIDAKYVGRQFVESAAVGLHDKYARMRLGGVPVVRDVVAVHPHGGFTMRWSGYGHVGASPGSPFPDLGLDRVIVPPRPVVVSGADPSEGLSPRLVQFFSWWRERRSYGEATDWDGSVASLLRAAFSGDGPEVFEGDRRLALADVGQLVRAAEIDRPGLGARPVGLLDFVRRLLQVDGSLSALSIGRYATTTLPFVTDRSVQVREPASGRLGALSDAVGSADEPFAVVYDQWWVETHAPSLRVDMSVLRRQWMDRGAEIFYVVGSDEGNRFAFQRAASAKQWSIWRAATRADQVRGASLLAESFASWFPTGVVLVIGSDEEFLAGLRSRGHSVRTLTSLAPYRLQA